MLFLLPSIIVVINPANQINSVKLNDENFLLWHIQVLAGIRGLGLEIFIHPDPPVPPTNLPDVTGAETLNPNFISWLDMINYCYLFFSHP